MLRHHISACFAALQRKLLDLLHEAAPALRNVGAPSSKSFPGTPHSSSAVEVSAAQLPHTPGPLIPVTVVSILATRNLDSSSIDQTTLHRTCCKDGGCRGRQWQRIMYAAPTRVVAPLIKRLQNELGLQESERAWLPCDTFCKRIIAR